ncbi:hypothetical protein ABIE18_000137 [Arthrobacter sp. 2762]
MSRSPKPPLPELLEFSERVNDLENKPAAELTLLSMAYLDTALGMAIAHRLQADPAVEYKLLNHDYSGAVLRNIASKIHMAAALGIMDAAVWQEVQDLCKVRDHYAHAFQHSAWDAPEVTKWTDKLQITREYRTADELRPSVDVDIDGVTGSGDGVTIDHLRNDFIVDPNDAIHFYCYGEPSEHVMEPAKRRYLESYWTCLFIIMETAVERWQIEIDKRGTTHISQPPQ